MYETIVKKLQQLHQEQPHSNNDEHCRVVREATLRNYKKWFNNVKGRGCAPSCFVVFVCFFVCVIQFEVITVTTQL